jgi:hypothetical protein
VDLASKSLEELQELVEWPSKMEEALQGQAAPETVEPVAPEPKIAEEVAEPEPAPTPEPVQPEDLEKDLLKAQIEAIEAHSKKMEAKLAGRESGEKGYIKQLQERIRLLEEEGRPPTQQEEPGPAPAPQRDGLRTWATQQAAKEAVASFFQSHPDIQELGPSVMEYLQGSGFLQTVRDMDDPVAASREVTRALDESYWHVKEERGRTRMAELQVKRADQVRGLDEAKKRAASSGLGTAKPPPSPRKTTKDLSLAELEAQMKALSGR